MISSLTGTHARIIMVTTSLIAFTSIAVAGLMAVRLSTARAALHTELQQCACCDDLQPGKTK